MGPGSAVPAQEQGGLTQRGSYSSIRQHLAQLGPGCSSHGSRLHLLSNTCKPWTVFNYNRTCLQLPQCSTSKPSYACVSVDKCVVW